MSNYLAPDEGLSVLDECYRNVAREAAELADLAKDCPPDDDIAGAIKLLGNAMERIAMARVMAQCEAQDAEVTERLTMSELGRRCAEEDAQMRQDLNKELADALEGSLLALDSLKDHPRLGPLTRDAIRATVERAGAALRSAGRLPVEAAVPAAPQMVRCICGTVPRPDDLIHRGGNDWQCPRCHGWARPVILKSVEAAEKAVEP